MNVADNRLYPVPTELRDQNFFFERASVVLNEIHHKLWFMGQSHHWS